MKHLIVGDLHSKKTNLSTIIKVLDQCKKLATKCDNTVFLGDLFDGKANIRSEAQRLFIQYFSDWPTPIIIIVGNHDYENSVACENHSLEALKLLSNITVIDKPTLIDNRYYVPYMPELQFKSLDFQGDYLFCHQDISGAKYSTQVPTNSVIEPALLSRYKKVFAGHIHLKQSFKNIIFVGTPCTESFKESNESKSIIVFNDMYSYTNTEKIIEVELNAPKHVTVTFTIASIDDISTVKNELNKTYKFDENLLLRLILNVPEEIEPKVKRSLFSDIPLTAFKTVKIATANKDIVITDSMSNKEMMEIYLKQLDLTPNQLTNVKKWNTLILKELK